MRLSNFFLGRLFCPVFSKPPQPVVATSATAYPGITSESVNLKGCAILRLHRSDTTLALAHILKHKRWFRLGRRGLATLLTNHAPGEHGSRSIGPLSEHKPTHSKLSRACAKVGGRRPGSTECQTRCACRRSRSSWL